MSPLPAGTKCVCGCGRSLEGRRTNAMYADPSCANAKRVEDDQWLYRMYDAAGELLYVGVTKMGVERFEKHGREKTWWREVVRIDVEHFESRWAVHFAEVKAIHEERPRYNRAGVLKAAPA